MPQRIRSKKTSRGGFQVLLVVRLLDLAADGDVCHFQAFLLESIERRLGIVSDGLRLLALFLVPAQVVLAKGEFRGPSATML
jgi:hypothetical protein